MKKSHKCIVIMNSEETQQCQICANCVKYATQWPSTNGTKMHKNSQKKQTGQLRKFPKLLETETVFILKQ